MEELQTILLVGTIATTSFNQLVSPSINTKHIVTSSDGCSDDNIDTIDIFVLPSFYLDFSTSEKQFLWRNWICVANICHQGIIHIDGIQILFN